MIPWFSNLVILRLTLVQKRQNFSFPRVRVQSERAEGSDLAEASLDSCSHLMLAWAEKADLECSSSTQIIRMLPPGSWGKDDHTFLCSQQHFYFIPQFRGWGSTVWVREELSLWVPCAWRHLQILHFSRIRKKDQIKNGLSSHHPGDYQRLWGCVLVWPSTAKKAGDGDDE